ncbi:MAG: hypothetical protein AAF959_02100 [Cyanobacteria bacterium P01_D01_bin.56]
MPLSLQVPDTIPKALIGGAQGLHRVQLNLYAATKKSLILVPGFAGQDLTDLSPTLRFISGNTTVTLTNGNGLTKTNNAAVKQEFNFVLTKAQKSELVGSLTQASVRWELSVTLPGEIEVAGDESSPYTGVFFINGPATGVAEDSQVSFDFDLSNPRSLVLRLI